MGLFRITACETKVERFKVETKDAVAGILFSVNFIIFLMDAKVRYNIICYFISSCYSVGDANIGLADKSRHVCRYIQ